MDMKSDAIAHMFADSPEFRSAIRCARSPIDDRLLIGQIHVMSGDENEKQREKHIRAKASAGLPYNGGK